MTLGSVHVGDLVLADRKGRRFFALVTGKGQGALDVEPIDRRVTYHHVRRARSSRSGTSAGCATDARSRVRPDERGRTRRRARRFVLELLVAGDRVP